MGCGRSKTLKDASAQGVVLLPDDAKAFRSLLEAFRECDPQFSSKIADPEKLTNVALKMSLSVKEASGTAVVFKHPTLQGKTAMNFPDFVEWSRENGVSLRVGLDWKKGLLCPRNSSARPFPLPHVWGAPTSGMDWNFLRPVTDDAQFAQLQHVVDLSYKKVWTRDRKATGDTRVPDSYELVKASRNENYRTWANYYMKTYHMDERHTKLDRWEVSTSTAPLSARHKLESRFNEWMLFHGTDQDAAEAVCKTGFATCLAGISTGTLYGAGTYFAESITKADEYSKLDKEGLCCTLLCRVAGGKVLYNDETTPDATKLQRAVFSGERDSVLGDREKDRNTFREFVIYDTDQCYAEYILWYRRQYGDKGTRGAPAAAVPPAAPPAAAVAPAAAVPPAAPVAPAAVAVAPAVALAVADGAAGTEPSGVDADPTFPVGDMGDGVAAVPADRPLDPPLDLAAPAMPAESAAPGETGPTASPE